MRETLLFAARIRLPASVPLAAKEALVDEVIAELGLAEAQHTHVGVSRPSKAPLNLGLCMRASSGPLGGGSAVLRCAAAFPPPPGVQDEPLCLPPSSKAECVCSRRQRWREAARQHRGGAPFAPLPLAAR